MRYLACGLAATMVAVTGVSLAAQEVPATTPAFVEQGRAALERLKAAPEPRTRARNVIIFIGDGMGMSTITAARIHAGQLLGRDGESYETTMDGLDHAALVKTYSFDAQVSDSAATATAIMSGVRTRSGVIGIGPEALNGDCASGKGHELPSLFGLAQQRGLATGIVTTTTVTHATPAATYGQTVQRNWESDADMPPLALEQGCIDLARQLVEGPVGRQLDVILGGGRAAFAPAGQADPEYPDKAGKRRDGRDLVAQWRAANPNGHYAWNSGQFAAFDPARHTKLFGLFEPSHLQFEEDRTAGAAGEPSLAEMVATAIAALSRSDQGYVLLVEGGRIDHAHHGGNARRALTDTVAMDQAVATALSLVDLDETLVLTTADHSHTLTIGGYTARGTPMLGTVSHDGEQPHTARDGKAYTTLIYANGLGAPLGDDRHDPAEHDTLALDYRQHAAVPLSMETHAGEDVVVRASGPGAHLFRGTIDQPLIYYIMEAALLAERPEE
mgnify:CR=1 FL=1